MIPTYIYPAAQTSTYIHEEWCILVHMLHCAPYKPPSTNHLPLARPHLYIISTYISSRLHWVAGVCVYWYIVARTSHLFCNEMRERGRGGPGYEARWFVRLGGLYVAQCNTCTNTHHSSAYMHWIGGYNTCCGLASRRWFVEERKAWLWGYKPPVIQLQQDTPASSTS